MPPGNRQRPAIAYCSVAGSPTELVDVASRSTRSPARSSSRAQARLGEVRAVARQVEVVPAVAEAARLPAAEVRDGDDRRPRPAPAPRRTRSQVAARLGRVLERVLEDDEVVRRRLERDVVERALRGRRRRARAAAAQARRRTARRPSSASPRSTNRPARSPRPQPTSSPRPGARAASDGEREAAQREGALESRGSRARSRPVTRPSASAYGPYVVRVEARPAPPAPAAAASCRCRMPRRRRRHTRRRPPCSRSVPTKRARPSAAPHAAHSSVVAQVVHREERGV